MKGNSAACYGHVQLAKLIRAVPHVVYGVGTSCGRLDPACLFFACSLVDYRTLARVKF